MDFYQRYREAQIAEQALLLGARLSVLKHELTIGCTTITSLAHGLGVTLNKGMLPSSVDYYLSFPQTADAALIAVLHARLSADTAAALRIERVIAVYTEYCEIMTDVVDQKPRLDFTRAWTLVRFLESGVLNRAQCPCCDIETLEERYPPIHRSSCKLCRKVVNHCTSANSIRAEKIDAYLRAQRTARAA